MDYLYPEFGLYSKVIADEAWKLDRLACRSLFVELLHSGDRVFLFSRGQWRFALMVGWGSDKDNCAISNSLDIDIYSAEGKEKRQ